MPRLKAVFLVCKPMAKLRKNKRVLVKFFR